VINAAAELSVLISIAGKDLVTILRIDHDAGEVPERQIATSTSPFSAAIMRGIEGLFSADIHMSRLSRILHNYIYRRFGGHSVYLTP
jgi:hypothetical protein